MERRISKASKKRTSCTYENMKYKKIRNLKLVANGSIILDHSLIVSDIHLGMESALGIELRLQTKQIIEEIMKTAKSFNIKEIILNGDLKFEFGKENIQEWIELRDLLKKLEKSFEIVLIKGNHDFYLENIAKQQTYEYVIRNDVMITHGHKYIPWKNTVVIGNEHPVIKIKDELGKIEKFRCFLEIDNIIVMPAFNWLSAGNNVLEAQFISPILKEKDWENARVYAIDGESIEYFGKIREIINVQKKLMEK